MIYNATKTIYEFFKHKEIGCEIAEVGKSSCVTVPYGIPAGPSIKLYFISNDNDNDVSVRVFGLLTNTGKERELVTLREINALNDELRYAKFTLDRHLNVNLEYDIPIECPGESLGIVCFEALIRSIDLATKGYIRLASIYCDSSGTRKSLVRRNRNKQ